MTIKGSAVVTGAASGIGRAVAERLAADGYGVIAVDCNADQLAEVVGGIDAAKGVARAVVGDVRERECHRLARRMAGEMAPLHAWVGCAGITRVHEFTELTEEQAREVVDVNQFGLLWSAVEAVSEWTATGSAGVLVLVSSVHAKHAFPRHAVYEMTKAAAEALVRNVAVTYGPAGIRAVAVAPGGVDTPPLRESLQSAADPAAALRHLEIQSPAERIGRPAEIAAVVSFLVSDEASYLSGTSIPVDGGWSAALGREATDDSVRRST